MDTVIIVVCVVAAVLALVGIVLGIVYGKKKKASGDGVALGSKAPEEKVPESTEKAAPESTENAPAASESQTERADNTEVSNEVGESAREVANDGKKSGESVRVVSDENGKTRRIVVKYNRSFLAKLIQSDERTKRYYSELKTKLLLCDGVKSRITWKCETFRKGRKTLAKLRLRGKTLALALALDPNDYEGTEYRVESLAEVKAYALTPCVYRIKNNRRLAYAKELIEELATENNITEKTTGENIDYAAQYPYEDTDALIARKLIKLVGTAQRGTTFKPIEDKREVAELEDKQEPAPTEENAENTEPEEITEVAEPEAEPDETVEVNEPEEPEAEPEQIEEVAESEAEPEETVEVDEPEVKEEAEPEVAPPEIREEVAATEVDKIMTDEVAARFIQKKDGRIDKTKQGIINIDTLSQNFESGEVVTLAEIKKRVKGFNQKTTYIKVLARGTLDKPLTVEADTFSIQAVKMIVLTGGKAIKKR